MQTRRTYDIRSFINCSTKAIVYLASCECGKQYVGCRLCPYGWLLHGDQCYYFSDVRRRTWNQSRDQCKMMGSDLLVIKDKEQQEFIERTLSQRTDDEYWIGLHPDGDGWRWVDGEQYNSSLFQIQTQPSGRCVSVTKSYYYQSSCSSAFRWMCVRKAVRI
ncbi:C-type lectin domain family 7 member A-like [Dendropsophus ebraccatus]|uniref:C-type lectin domain family 7 member A-like n=1 Tax=Dendropsophus ebraccatus TaxID=150705 RepID=UPI003831E770